ncbi:pitrilysin family protein [Bacillaceae bacterium]
MKEIHYEQLNETLYYKQLDNGLAVYILPKSGFSHSYATFTTKYGSIDNHFRPPGEEAIKVPDGIAHFLEHKMFEQKDGDVFNAFARQGASANAFTSFTRTAYLFSCTEQLEKNLQTLLDFVQDPYFTEEGVEKEKGIIGQEIRMYEDNPDWRVYFGLLQSLYRSHPVRIDIAGTIESISRITKDLLYKCYRTFYHPSNMLLFVVGNLDPARIMHLVEENQIRKNYDKQPPIDRFRVEEPAGVAAPRNEVALSVGLPKCLLGFKDKDAGLSGEALLHREQTTALLLDILFSPSSDLYQFLYEEGLINDSFTADYTLEHEYGFSAVGGDTKDPDRLVDEIKRFLAQKRETGIGEEEFVRSKKKKLGSFLRSLNSLEFIANSFTRYRFNDSDLFQIVPVLERISLDDVNDRLREHIDFSQMAVSIVRSDGE